MHFCKTEYFSKTPPTAIVLPYKLDYVVNIYMLGMCLKCWEVVNWITAVSSKALQVRYMTIAGKSVFNLAK